MATRTTRPGAARWLVVFVALAVLHTWPLATDPGTLSRNDNADAQLNAWVIAWVAHQIPRDPLHLFDANIFHPEPRTLAFSEHLILPSLMAAPLLWLGVSPVLAHNLLVILGLALTGWTTWLVAVRWTGDAWAATLAGCAAAFNAHLLTRIPQVQAAQAAFLPLALLALDRLLAHPDTRAGLRLAWWFTLQALSSTYLMIFTTVACAAAIAARPAEWLGARAAPTLRALLVASAVALAALGPVMYPYYRASIDQGLTRSLGEVARYSATPASYLATAGRIHYQTWARGFYEASDSSLFPGVATLVLAALALAAGVGRRNPRARMMIAVGLAGLVLSFGPTIPGVPLYEALYHAFPPLQGIRNASRFGYLTIVALAVLAAFGLAHVRAGLASGGRRGQALAVAVAAVALVNLEAARAPMSYTRFDGIPAIYDRVAGVPGAVVAELPFPSLGRIAANAPYVLASTRHWKPLVNGYSGFAPRAYAERARVLGTFPSGEAVDLLDRLGVTHVVVHGRELREALGGSPVRDRFVLEARSGDDWLMALRRER